VIFFPEGVRKRPTSWRGKLTCQKGGGGWGPPPVGGGGGPVKSSHRLKNSKKAYILPSDQNGCPIVHYSINAYGLRTLRKKEGL